MAGFCALVLAFWPQKTFLKPASHSLNFLVNPFCLLFASIICFAIPLISYILILSVRSAYWLEYLPLEIVATRQAKPNNPAGPVSWQGL